MQLTTQITLQRAGEDGLKSPRITHQQPASDNYTSVADVHFFFLSILKNGSKWVFVQMFKGLDLQPHMENCEETHWAVTSLFMKAATVESALQALPWYQGLTVLFFFFLCVCVETGGSWVASEIALPPAEDHWKKKKEKMMTEHLLSPASSSFYCLSLLTEVFSLQLLFPFCCIRNRHQMVPGTVALI